MGRGAKKVLRIDSPGVTVIDYDEDAGLIYAAAAETAQLTVARVDDSGKPTPLVVVPTTKGARSVVAGANGCAYLIDPLGGRILNGRAQLVRTSVDAIRLDLPSSTTKSFRAIGNGFGGFCTDLLRRLVG